MRITEVIISSIVVVLMFLSVGTSGRPWRPQGRFGKRTFVLDQPRLTDTPSSDFEHTMDIPVEVFRVLNPAARPRLCTISGAPGFPTCERRNLFPSSSPSLSSSSSSHSIKTMQDLVDLFERQ